MYLGGTEILRIIEAPSQDRHPAKYVLLIFNLSTQPDFSAINHQRVKATTTKATTTGRARRRALGTLPPNPALRSRPHAHVKLIMVHSNTSTENNAPNSLANFGGIAYGVGRRIHMTHP